VVARQQAQVGLAPGSQHLDVFLVLVFASCRARPLPALPAGGMTGVATTTANRVSSMAVTVADGPRRPGLPAPTGLPDDPTSVLALAARAGDAAAIAATPPRPTTLAGTQPQSWSARCRPTGGSRSC
jgi:hypothetical protein